MPQRPTALSAGAINFTFQRKNVKNINIRIRADGSVAVSAPMRCSMERILRFVTEKEAWICAAQAKIEHNTQDVVPPPYTKAEAAAVFAPYLEAVYPLFAETLGGERPILKVRDMKTRWGVCNLAKRQITLNLRLADKDPALIQYVVVHEYAHFIEPNHSPAFWQVVSRILPDWKIRRALLRKG